MLRFANKQLRAEVIAAYLRKAGRFDAGVVCFSCGNASRALQAVGLHVVDISPAGELHAGSWWRQADIARAFPAHFDATSGHLHAGLMAEIGAAYRAALGDLPDRVEVPAGSGETVVCLAMAYPATAFVAVYDDSNPATTWSADAPLNALVKRLCAVRYAGCQSAYLSRSAALPASISAASSLPSCE